MEIKKPVFTRVFCKSSALKNHFGMSAGEPLKL
jgi:hypothetical protein